ncbi:hypothetical protein [Candidatus Berkiella aquae]|uniref:Uncharacterized protein n=1 Tax=Candidatus Berkiella aquae TaxID=295108 RepID=A0A0Q9YJP4_9GAMM|nr:hypothetical protein [Candidatus Berkiella aquae]MCS5711362.1 hypothetical protein [Candidatus Berkiella aquae]
MANVQKDAFDELMKQFPQKTYDQYSNLLDLARNFGNDVVKQKLVNKPEDELKQIRKGLKQHSGQINELVSTLYANVQEFIQKHHPERAEPSHKKDERLENAVGNELQRRLLEASWMKNTDEAADPKVDNARRRAQAADSKEAQPFVEQFKNAVKAEVENRLKAKLKAMPQPKPGKKIEPRPY